MLVGLCTGCSADRTFACTENADCVRSGVEGQCLVPGHCVFGDGDCESGMRWDSTAPANRADTCVEPGEPDGEEANACGGRTLLPGSEGDACGLCNSGILACDGPEAFACVDEPTISEPLSPEGSAASSIFGDGDDFISSLAIDGDLTTSWFSDGVEDDDTATFEWIGGAEECIGRIEFDGNDEHPDFSENFGFETVTVRVLRGNGEVVFSQEQDLSGTPDPAFSMDVGVIGHDVELVFEEPEDDACGGFSELRVFSLR